MAAGAPPWGQLPPELQGPAPPPSGQMGRGGAIARALQNITLRPKQVAAMQSQRDAYVAAAAQRLQAIGSPEAQRFAEILVQNPEGATRFVEQYGGWQAVETGLRNAAAAGAARGIAASLPENSPERAYADYQAEVSRMGGTPDFSQSVGYGFQGREAGLDRGLTREQMQARREEAAADRAHELSIWEKRFEQMGMDRASAEKIAGLRARAARDAAENKQRITATEVNTARQAFLTIAKAKGWDQDAAKLRSVITKAKSNSLQDLYAAMQLPGNAGDEAYAAFLYKQGHQYLGDGDDWDYQFFSNLPVRDFDEILRQQRDAGDEEAANAYMQSRTRASGRR